MDSNTVDANDANVVFCPHGVPVDAPPAMQCVECINAVWEARKAEREQERIMGPRDQTADALKEDIKTPVGVIPRSLHLLNRNKELSESIRRYVDFLIEHPGADEKHIESLNHSIQLWAQELADNSWAIRNKCHVG